MNSSPAFSAEAFEHHVQLAATPKDFRGHLLRFIKRHAPEVKVVVGNRDGYDWRTGVLMLTRDTATGDGMRSLLIVAHECAHAHQRRDWPWLPAWALNLPVVRLWIENDAWQRSLRMLS